MATTERDYYELLGVGRDATEAEIKKAFRALARELHPDVSDAPDAHDRFREVVEAYEVLSKSESRTLYDRYGHAGLRSGGFQPGQFDFGSLSDLFSAFFGDDVLSGRGGGSRGADVGAVVEIDLVEAAQGATREVPFEVAVACAHCGGDGSEPGTIVTVCPTCGGVGRRAAGLAQRVRRVRAHADVPDLRRLRPEDRDAVHRRAAVPDACSTSARSTVDIPRGYPRRPAHPDHGSGPRGRAGNARRRRVRPGARPAGPALRP